MKELTKSEKELFQSITVTNYIVSQLVESENYDIALSELSNISYIVKLLRSQIKSRIIVKSKCEACHA